MPRAGRACYAAGVNDYRGSPIAPWVFALVMLLLPSLRKREA